MMRLRVALCAVAALAASVVLSGCSASFAPSSISDEPALGVAIEGRVHGGQQPVTGASIQLYAASTSGYSGAATPLLSGTVTTQAGGSFSLTGLYSCPTADTQVYLVSTGGNPGLAAGTNNAQMALMAALGSCGNLQAGTFITINEATTVAAVWALQSFMSDAAHVGTSSTNVAGLKNAFASAAQLVNTASGTAPGTGLPAGSVTPVPQVNTIANILAACMNTVGGASGDGSVCGKLMLNATPPGGTAPTNTIAAGLNMSRYPGNNLAALYTLNSATAPFQPSLATAPYDFTLSIGFSGPTRVQQLVLDASSNVYILDAPSQSSTNTTFTAKLWSYTNQGTTLQAPLSILDAAYIDMNPDGTMWVNYSGGQAYNANGSNTSSICIQRMTTAGVPLISLPCFAPLPNFASLAINFVDSQVTASPNGSVWVGSNTLGLYGASGSAISNNVGLQGGGYASYRSILSTAIDTSGDAWIAFTTSNGVPTLSEFSPTGVALTGSSGVTGNGLPNPQAIAIDRNGTVWVASDQSYLTSYHSVITPFSSAGVPLTASGYQVGYAAVIGRMMVDGDNTLWVQSWDNTSTGLNHFTTTGTDLSAGANYGYLMTYQTPASTTETQVYDGYEAVIDNAGNVWNWGMPYGTTSMYFYKMVGVAAPVITPLSYAGSLGKLGTRP